MRPFHLVIFGSVFWFVFCVLFFGFCLDDLRYPACCLGCSGCFNVALVGLQCMVDGHGAWLVG